MNERVVPPALLEKSFTCVYAPNNYSHMSCGFEFEPKILINDTVVLSDTDTQVRAYRTNRNDVLVVRLEH